MPENCFDCRLLISRSNPGLKCSGVCHKWYHIKCVKLPAELVENLNIPGLSWTCSSCMKTGQPTNVNMSQVSDMSTKFQEMISNFEILKKKQEDMLLSVEYSSACIDNFNTKMSEFSVALKKIDFLEKKIVDLEKENSLLTAEVEDLQQYSRKNNLEINGIPQRNGENVMNIVKNIGNLVGVDISQNCIDACHRVPSRNQERNNKPIIVKFTSRIVKQNLLAATKANRHLMNASKLELPSMPEQKIYVSDHLTPKNKALLYKSKIFCRENNFKFVWVNDCKILVRKNETSRIVHIQNEASLSRLV